MVGTDSYFLVTGNAAVTSIVVNFANAWPAGVSTGGGPICSVTAENAAASAAGVVRESTTTTAITLTMSSASGAKYQIHCGE